MKENNMNSPMRQVLVTLIVYLSIILAALLLGMTHQIASWVAQIAIALSLFRLVFMLGWGMAKKGWGWRV